MHLQTEPYRVTEIEKIDPTWALIEQLRRLQQDPDLWSQTLERLKAEGVPVAIVTAALYGIPWQKQIDGSSITIWGVGTSGGVIQCSLHTAYDMTAGQDTHDFFNDVSATEVPATGAYTANGKVLDGKTSNYTSATDVIWLDANDVSWAASTISATDAIVWENTAGASSTDPVRGAVDFGGTVATTSGTFQITWDTNGIINFDVT
jgi:hypothetical protein